MVKTKENAGIPAQEPEAAAAAAAEQAADINETDGEPIFHADEEAGGGDA